MRQISAANKAANNIPLATREESDTVFDMDAEDGKDDRALLEADELIRQEEEADRKAAAVKEKV